MTNNLFPTRIILVMLTALIYYPAGSSKLTHHPAGWKSNFYTNVFGLSSQSSFNTSKLDVYFIKAAINKIRDTLLSWQRPLIKKQNNNTLSAENINGDINSAWQQLLPLTAGEIRRYLLVPTNSEWVALLDNSSSGTDGTCPYVVAQRLKAKMIRVSCDKNTSENLVDYAAVVKDRYQPVRSVGVIKEDGWEFVQYGKPFLFEETKKYRNDVIKSRFTFSQLHRFLKHFGIDAFNDKFYMPLGTAILIKKIGPINPQS